MIFNYSRTWYVIPKVCLSLCQYLISSFGSQCALIIFMFFSCDFYLLDGPITKLAHLEDRLKEIKYISVVSVHVPMSITKM